MMQRFFKYLPITTLIITYLFICGGLYIIGFWSIFKLDISNFITIYDIPKNFVFPFTISAGFILLQQMANITSLTQDEEKKVDDDGPEKHAKEKGNIFLRVAKSPDVLISFFFLVIFLFYDNYKTNISFWLIISASTVFLVLYKISAIDYINKLVKTPLLRSLLLQIVVVPLFCFFTGKVISLYIYNNFDIQLINITNSITKISSKHSQAIKLIGFLGNKTFASTLDNKTIIIINDGSYTNIQLTYVKSLK